MSHATATRQAFVRAADDVVVLDVPRAPLAPEQIRIDVAFAGICGSDLHVMLAAGAAGLSDREAVEFGHEYSGIVREVGADVTGIEVGQRVACVPRIPCLRCHPCRLGRLTSCTAQVRPPRGAWAEEIVVPQRAVYALPSQVTLREAALCEPLSCALRGIDRARAPVGHIALVLGGGPIGLMVTALALRSGATHVLLSEPRAARRRLAEQLGATAVDPGAQDLVEVVSAATDGRGVEVVYEAVGRPEGLAEAVELVAPGGTVVVLGVAPPDAVAPIRPWRLFERELTVVAAWGQETTFQRALEWLPQLDLGRIVTHELPLERIADALALAASGDCGKVLLRPQP
jgi:2-desacetyl-2-hydroxyethyl bacteriochlorophyllide A dehydrogenase